MGFHDKPHTKGVTIGGKHTYSDLGLVLIDGSESIGLPEVQTYQVEVPGRNGLLDLTEALNGEVAYKNRECSWQFADAREYGERTDALVKIANMLHGRKLDFVLDDRPEYTGTGRFEASVEENIRGYSILNVTADCEPFFSKGTKTLRMNAAGGIKVSVESGRMPVCPTFEFNSETIVSMGDVSARMQPGTYKVRDLWLHQGQNLIYLNSYMGYGNVPISDHASEPIGGSADKFISNLMWDGIRGAAIAVEDWKDDTISSHAGTTVTEAEYAVATDTEEYAVYMQYEWLDL
jgi:hypothetical protein|nr:MAG TPA: distal tail protein [Caudoviricetes sp.]